jgi:hypothetical protein
MHISSQNFDSSTLVDGNINLALIKRNAFTRNTSCHFICVNLDYGQG